MFFTPRIPFSLQLVIVSYFPCLKISVSTYTYYAGTFNLLVCSCILSEYFVTLP